jgi:ribonucleoside-diphosphate reductase alpha chain
LKLAEKVMKFITEAAREKSAELGDLRGNFPNFKGSKWDRSGYQSMRNSTTTTIAPTGTISIIANSSSGIEPIFALVFVRRNVLGGETELIEVNPVFEKYAKEKGFYSEELMKLVSNTGSINHVERIPSEAKRIFVTSHDIQPDWHVRMQAAFQKHTDNAVSKTINLPADAGIEEVDKAYRLAYKTKCKGITIYRDQSKIIQVLHLGKDSKDEETKPEMRVEDEILRESGETCPMCGAKLYSAEGCQTCISCGYSKCSVA